MTNDGPKHPNDKGKMHTQSPLDPELISGMMDALAQFPEETREWVQGLKALGMSIEVQMHVFVAGELLKSGSPIPPALREYLRENADELTPRARKKLLGIDPN